MSRCALVAASAALLAASAGAQVQITAFDQPGVLEWTNSLQNVSDFDVQWSSSPGGGSWQASWQALTNLPATAATYQVSVPMCYRVMARTNILRSRWTLLFYLDGDNDLEPDFISKTLKLNRWNSDTNVQIVVQFARLGNQTSYGGWHSCERFYVTNGIVFTQANAVQDWGDGAGGRLLDMAEPANLTAFIDWAASLYPADHYAVFVGDHGFGWNGMCICWSYAKSTFYLPDLRTALNTARVSVDLLVLDACLMSMVETLAELRYTNLKYVLSSETYGECDWPYGWMLEGVQANPGWTPWEFVSDLNARLWDYYSTSNVVHSITLCTADLSRAPDLVTNVALFVAGALDTNVPLATAQARARDAMDSITNTLVIRHLGTNWDNKAYGLAVYFPLKDGLVIRQSFDDYTAKRTLFAQEGNWRTLLETYYDPMGHPPYHSQINDARAATTNYLDGGGASGYGNEHIDLYDFCRAFAEAPP